MPSKIEYGTRLVIQRANTTVPEKHDFYGDNHGLVAIRHFEAMATKTPVRNPNTGKDEIRWDWPGTHYHVFLPIERFV